MSDGMIFFVDSEKEIAQAAHSLQEGCKKSTKSIVDFWASKRDRIVSLVMLHKSDVPADKALKISAIAIGSVVLVLLSLPTLFFSVYLLADLAGSYGRHKYMNEQGAEMDDVSLRANRYAIQMRDKEEEIAGLTQVKDALQAAQSEAASLISQANHQIVQLRQQEIELTQRVQELSLQYSTQAWELQGRQDDLQKKREELDAVAFQRANLDRQLIALKRELAEAQQEVERLRPYEPAYREAANTLAIGHLDLMYKYRALKEQNILLNQQLAERLEQDVDTTRANLKQSGGAVQELEETAEVKALRERLSALEAQAAVFRETAEKQAIQNTLLNDELARLQVLHEEDKQKAEDRRGRSPGRPQTSPVPNPPPVPPPAPSASTSSSSSSSTPAPSITQDRSSLLEEIRNPQRRELRKFSAEDEKKRKEIQPPVVDNKDAQANIVSSLANAIVMGITRRGFSINPDAKSPGNGSGSGSEEDDDSW